jgi:hypothetical protein
MTSGSVTGRNCGAVADAEDEAEEDENEDEDEDEDESNAFKAAISVADSWCDK